MVHNLASAQRERFYAKLKIARYWPMRETNNVAYNCAYLATHPHMPLAFREVHYAHAVRLGIVFG